MIGPGILEGDCCLGALVLFERPKSSTKVLAEKEERRRSVAFGEGKGGELRSAAIVVCGETR